VGGDMKRLVPVIIKRRRRARRGHGSAAWKIAYADFVTAMMAFFLLMWLLGSTTEGDRKGLQDFFASPLKISLPSGGSGSGDASHIVKGGGTDITRTTGQVRKGQVASDRGLVNLRASHEEQRRLELLQFEALKQRLEGRITGSAQLAPLREQIRMDMAGDGLRIEIVDAQDRPMFGIGSAELAPYMRELLHAFGAVLAEVPNRLTIEGHTDAQPYQGGERLFSNWELSSERANASRRELVAGGMPQDRVLRVLGLASSLLLDPSDPFKPVNRRISIVVMHSS